MIAKKKVYPERIYPERRRGSRRAFTLIEMLVSVGIIIVIASVSVVGLSSAKSSTASSSGADEIKRLIEELKSLAAGQDGDLKYHYVLIINAGRTTQDVCNKYTGTENQISRNSYLICSSDDKILPSLSLGMLNSKFTLVRGGHMEIDTELNLSFTNITDTGGLRVINARSYDSQLGYDLKYVDTLTPGPLTADGQIRVEKGNFIKTINIDYVLGNVKFL